MTDRNKLRDLEERHDEARAAARRRIETADERLMHYRSRRNAIRATIDDRGTREAPDVPRVSAFDRSDRRNQDYRKED